MSFEINPWILSAESASVSRPSWTVDSRTETSTNTNTHINRAELSSDPLFAEQMTATIFFFFPWEGDGVFRCLLLYSCHSVFGALRAPRDLSSPHRKPHTASARSHIFTALSPRRSHIHPLQPHPGPPSPSQSTLGSFQFASQLAPGFPSPVKRQAICCALRLMPRRALNTHIKSWRLNRFSFANLYRTEVQSVSLEVYTP